MIGGIHTQNTVPNFFHPWIRLYFLQLVKIIWGKLLINHDWWKSNCMKSHLMYVYDVFFFNPTIDKILFSMILDISWWKNKRAPFVFSSIKMMFWTQIAKHQMAENGDQNMKWTRHMKQNIIGIWFSDRPRQFVTRPVW